MPISPWRPVASRLNAMTLRKALANWPPLWGAVNDHRKIIVYANICIYAVLKSLMSTVMSKRFPIFERLRIPAVASPLFIISNPDLVIAQCKAGIVGSFPALNARPVEELDRWLIRINEGLDRHNQKNPDRPAAPYAVNQIVHRTNDRLEHDIEACVRHRVPIVITSLGARKDLNDAEIGRASCRERV